jgi:hypothetical protein
VLKAGNKVEWVFWNYYNQMSSTVTYKVLIPDNAVQGVRFVNGATLYKETIKGRRASVSQGIDGERIFFVA